MKVGIIGGGIAGLSTALALQKAGYAFHLFEQSEQFREVGACINLNSSAAYLLDQLGVGEHFREVSIPISAFNIVKTNLEKVRGLPCFELSYSIHRAKLIEVLSKPLSKDSFTLNSRIEQIEQANQKVIVRVNNQQHEFDFLIAADGIHSATRKQFLPSLKPRYTGQVMWRGMTKIDLPTHFDNCITELWGQNKRFGIMQRKGNEYFWYCVRWAKENEPFELSSEKENLKELFAQFNPIVNKILDQSENVIRTNLYDMEPGNYSWFNNRIVFVGDCIHACTPHLSQGGCQALESAYVLVGCLQKQKNNIQAAFELYQQKRSSKANDINYYSYRFGRISHQRKNWQDNVLHTALKYAPEAYLKFQFKKTVDLKSIEGLW